jgi:hypothetical protein
MQSALPFSIVTNDALRQPRRHQNGVARFGEIQTGRATLLPGVNGLPSGIIIRAVGPLAKLAAWHIKNNSKTKDTSPRHKETARLSHACRALATGVIRTSSARISTTFLPLQTLSPIM